MIKDLLMRFAGIKKLEIVKYDPNEIPKLYKTFVTKVADTEKRGAPASPPSSPVETLPPPPPPIEPIKEEEPPPPPTSPEKKAIIDPITLDDISLLPENEKITLGLYTYAKSTIMKAILAQIGSKKLNEIRDPFKSLIDRKTILKLASHFNIPLDQLEKLDPKVEEIHHKFEQLDKWMEEHEDEIPPPDLIVNLANVYQSIIINNRNIINNGTLRSLQYLLSEGEEYLEGIEEGLQSATEELKKANASLEEAKKDQPRDEQNITDLEDNVKEQQNYHDELKRETNTLNQSVDLLQNAIKDRLKRYSTELL